MPYTLRAEYAGVFMHIGDATDVMKAAAMVRVAVRSVPIECLRVSDPEGALLDTAELLDAVPPEQA